MESSNSGKKKPAGLKRARPLVAAPAQTSARPSPDTSKNASVDRDSLAGLKDSESSVARRYARNKPVPVAIWIGAAVGGLAVLSLMFVLVSWLTGVRLTEKNGVADAPSSSTDVAEGAPGKATEKDSQSRPDANPTDSHLTALIGRLEPSVVKIEVTGPLGRGIGSGFFIDGRGTLVTNYHVVRYARSAQVTFSDGTRADVDGFVAADPRRDLVALRIASVKRQFVPLRICADPPAKGTRVLALGAPRGFSFTPTEGIVSAVRSGHEVKDAFLDEVGFDVFKHMGFDVESSWIQSTALVSPGNSGGPLVNMRGELVGVNTWTKPNSPGLNFAVSGLDVMELTARVADGPVVPLADLPRPSSDDGPGSVASSAGNVDKKELTSPLAPTEAAVFDGHDGGVRDVAVSHDGAYVATAGDDGFCVALNSADLTEVHRFGPHGARVTGAAFVRVSADTTIAVSTEVTARGSILFWSLEQRELVHEFPADSRTNSYGLRIAPKQDRLAIAIGNSSARLYFVSPYSRIGLEVGDKSQPCRAVAFSPDSHLLLTGSGPKVIVWRFENQRGGGQSSFGESSRSIVNAIEFPEGGIVYTGHDDGVVRAWDFETRELVQEYLGHAAAINDIAVSPDFPLVFAVGDDKTIRVWEQGQPIAAAVIRGHESGVTGVALLPGTKRVVSCGRDGTVRLWHLFPPEKSSEEPAKPPRSPSVLAQRVPVPAADRLTSARELIREVFRDEFERATGRSERIRLAERLLTQAGQSDNAGERYALLSEAGRLGIAAGSVSTAMDAADSIVAGFEVDGPAILVGTLKHLEDAVRTTEDRAEFSRRALRVCQEATSRKRFDLALEAVEMGNQAALSARDGELLKTSRETLRIATENAACWTAYRQANESLAKDPADAGARRVAGKFACAYLQDWSLGLNHLVQGDDAKMATAAKLDLAGPTGPEQRIRAGDAWLEAVDEQGTVEQGTVERAAFLDRAAMWYRRALPELSTLRKLKVEKALAQIEAEMPPLSSLRPDQSDATPAPSTPDEDPEGKDAGGESADKENPDKTGQEKSYFDQDFEDP